MDTKAKWAALNAAIAPLDSDDVPEYLEDKECPDCGRTSLSYHCEADTLWCEACSCHDATGYWPEQMSAQVVAAHFDKEGTCESCGNALDRHLVCRQCDMERRIDAADLARDEVAS